MLLDDRAAERAAGSITCYTLVGGDLHREPLELSGIGEPQRAFRLVLRVDRHGIRDFHIARGPRPRSRGVTRQRPLRPRSNQADPGDLKFALLVFKRKSGKADREDPAKLE